MRFDQSFRRLQFNTYPTEEFIQETRFVNTDQALLSLRQTERVEPVLWVGKHALPRHLSLQALLKPVYYNFNVEAQYVFNQQPMTSRALYDRTQTLQSMDLVALKDASFYFKNRIESLKQMEKSGIYLKQPQGFLYRQVFAVQHNNVSLAVQSQGNAFFLFTPPSLRNVYPLWAHGGVYYQGCDLSDIAQSFFGLETHNKETFIRAITLKNLKQAGLNPPHPGIYNNQNIVFIDQEVSGHSLQEEVEKGSIEVQLVLGKGEEAETYPYVSQSIRYLNPLSGHVVIHFIRKGT
jgi:hypothetical protein